MSPKPSTEIALVGTPQSSLAPMHPDVWACLYDAATFKQIESVAKAIQNSALLPPHMRGKVDDITLALAMARAMGENPIIVLQSIYVVSGRAGWSASYVIARANGSGKFRGPLQWTEQGRGDDLAVTCFATVAETGDRVESTVSMATARAENWTKNPKYRTMPDLMLRYRSATRLVRLYAPEVLMGLAERYELVDGDRDVDPVPVEYVVDPPSSSSSARPSPGAGMAAALPGGVASGPSEDDGPPSLELARSSPGSGHRTEASSTSSTAAPSGEDTRSTSAGEAGSTPAARASTPSNPPAPSAATGCATPIGAGPREEDPQRAEVLAALGKLREAHPDLVKEIAKGRKLVSPSKASTNDLRVVVELVRARVALALLSDEALISGIHRAQEAAEAQIGPEETLEIARAIGLPIEGRGPVLDGAPRSWLDRYFVALEQVVQL
jgi:hypothetical protein